MAKREKSKFVVEQLVDHHWIPWDEEGPWESTAEALRSVRLMALKSGEYRVIQVKAQVQVTVEKVSKVRLAPCKEVTA